MSRCGYISIIGKTNVGKSTLLNSIFDKKVSITSKTSQTTRSNIYAIKNINNSQAIFIDTPGIHSKTNKTLNKILRKKPKEVLNDVDLILFIISGSKFDELDEETFKLVKDSAPKKVLLINKIDLLKNKTELFEFVNSFKEKEIFDSIILMISNISIESSLLSGKLRISRLFAPIIFEDCSAAFDNSCNSFLGPSCRHCATRPVFM